MSTTPRTDKFAEPTRGLGTGYYQALNFARQLETELNEALASKDAISKRAEAIRCQLVKVTLERDKLKETCSWKGFVDKASGAFTQDEIDPARGDTW